MTIKKVFYLSAITLFFITSMSAPTICGEQNATDAEKGGKTAENEKAESQTTKRQKILETLVDKDMLSRWDICAGLEKIVTMPTGKGNAAEHYAKLEGMYEKERLIKKNKDGKEEKSLSVSQDGQGVQEVLAGAKIKDCHLTPKYYPYMSKGTSKQPDVIIWQAYRQALGKYAEQLEKDGKIKEAGEALEAGMIWGMHIINERPSLIALVIGTGIQLKIGKRYSLFLQRRLDIDRSRKLTAYLEQLTMYRKKITIKSRVYLGDTANFNSLFSTIKISKYDQDYLWRQEAVIKLGIYRFGIPNKDMNSRLRDKEWEKAAKDALIYVANNDPAPWVRQLAMWSIKQGRDRIRDMMLRSEFKHKTAEDDDDNDNQQKSEQ